MPRFGRRSTNNLRTCDDDLQDILNEAIKHIDFSCIWGHRDMEAQNKAYNEGHSQLRWPHSRHNAYPARAFDVIPYPKGFEASDQEFYLLATYILRAANDFGVHLRWGGHWTSLRDLAHFELIDD